MKNKVFLSLLTVFTLLMISQTASATTHVIGEAGLETGLSSAEWQSVSLDSGLYSDTPLVFVTTQTVNGGDNPSSAHLRSVSQSGFDTQHCEPDAYACDSHAAEDNAWLAVDQAKVEESVGMDAGTVSLSGEGSTTVSFSESTIDTTPIVIAQVQSNNGAVPINAKVTSVDSNGATITMCEQSSQNGCNTGHTTETIAWFAITTEEADRLSGWTANWEDKGDSDWVRTDFMESFGSAPGVQVTTQTQNGGEDDLYPEVNDVTTAGADMRLCEYEGDGTCDTHATETLGYIAVENGQVSANKHMCNTGDMRVDLRAMNGVTATTTTAFSHYSSSGNCRDGNDVVETWDSDTDYGYCPLEGGYDARMQSYTEQDPYSWEYDSYVSDLYTVDYDVKEWCGCGDAYGDNNYQWIYSDGNVQNSNVDSAADNSYGCCEDDNVLWYDFESINPYNPVDRYGNNDGEFRGGAELRTTTPHHYTGDRGAYFDGNDDYLLVPDSSSLDLTREFSISAWIMHEDPDHTQNIVTKESAYEVAVDTDGTLKWAFYTAGGWEWHDTGVSVPANEWHHVIFSYNGDSTTVYLDGSSVSTIADPQGGPIDTNGNDVWVGAREGGGSGSAWFQGYIDEVRITSSAVGPQEASHLHQHGVKETWTDPDTGEPACVNGERVDHGGVSSGRRYIVQDGKIHFCKEPAQEDAPESFMSTFSECDSINAGGVTYYCGAGGTQQQGKWYSLPNSQCLEITSIRGTRIRTVN